MSEEYANIEDYEEYEKYFEAPEEFTLEGYQMSVITINVITALLTIITVVTTLYVKRNVAKYTPDIYLSLAISATIFIHVCLAASTTLVLHLHGFSTTFASVLIPACLTSVLYQSLMIYTISKRLSVIQVLKKIPVGREALFGSNILFMCLKIPALGILFYFVSLGYESPDPYIFADTFYDNETLSSTAKVINIAGNCLYSIILMYIFIQYGVFVLQFVEISQVFKLKSSWKQSEDKTTDPSASVSIQSTPKPTLKASLKPLLALNINQRLVIVTFQAFLILSVLAALALSISAIWITTLHSNAIALNALVTVLTQVYSLYLDNAVIDVINRAKTPQGIVLKSGKIVWKLTSSVSE